MPWQSSGGCPACYLHSQLPPQVPYIDIRLSTQLYRMISEPDSHQFIVPVRIVSLTLHCPAHEPCCDGRQAVLDPAAEDGARVWLRCKVQDGAPLAVAALRCGGAEAQPLDLILDQYAEFTVQGPAAVHVTGAGNQSEGRAGNTDRRSNWCLGWCSGVSPGPCACTARQSWKMTNMLSCHTITSIQP